jgi:hypothetical protein
MAEIVTLLLDDDREAWVEGVYSSEDEARAAYRDYLVSRFGLDEVERIEAEGGDFAGLVGYKIGFFEAPV